MTSFHNKFLVLCILTSLAGIISSSPLNAQYRDAFSEKKKRQKIKKNNKKGLIAPFRNRFTGRMKDPFNNINDFRAPKGTIGIGNDPFSNNGRTKYKPTGIDSDTFSYRQRKRAIEDKYNKDKVKRKSYKSRLKHYKFKMKYG